MKLLKRLFRFFTRSRPPQLQDSVTAAFTLAVWRALSRLPSLETMPEVAFIRVRRETNSLVNRYLVEASRPRSEKLATEFSFRRGFDGFQIDLAGAVVCRLEAFLHKTNNLDLITRLLPEAISASVIRVIPCTIAGRPGTYRLLGDGIPV